MSGTCTHGFDPASCLICRTLATNAGATATAEAPKSGRRGGDVRGAPSLTSFEHARPDRVDAQPPSGAPTRHHSLTGSLVLAVAALLAIGAAIWILVGVVFTVLRLFELVVVAAGAGWVGYKIGHFRGSRHPRR